LAVTLGPLLGLFSETGEAVVLAVYLADKAVGDERAGDDLTELDWFSPEALPQLAFPHDTRIVELWRELSRGR
jgi:hypothetical protein